MKKGIRKHKKIGVFLGSVILPLLGINIILWGLLLYNQKKEQVGQAKTCLEHIRYEFNKSVTGAVTVMDYMTMDDRLREFLERKYQSESEYYKYYNLLMEKNIIKYYYTAQSMEEIRIAADNETIVSGSYFSRIKDVQKEEWYQEYQSDSKAVQLRVWFDEKLVVNPDLRRRISIIENMQLDGGTRAVFRIDLDYNSLRQSLMSEYSDMEVYLCEGDQIVFNSSDIIENGEFQRINEETKKRALISDSMAMYGKTWYLYARTKTPLGLLKNQSQNLLFIVMIFIVDLIIPVFAALNISRIERERQILRMSRKQAELSALQSQMNPHFMFNTLESIRMNCMLNGEDETEEIIGKFALLLRQATQWDRDYLTIQEEIQFVRSYLDIQKYRFGDRVTYEITAEESCLDKNITKFGILTFVENAWIHGIEKRKAGKICLDVRESGGRICIKVSDNGKGMDGETLYWLRRRINQASIEDLYNSSHVGILNAVIRMKSIFAGDASIDLDSREGKGTLVVISVPAREGDIDNTDTKEKRKLIRRKK